MSSPRQHPRAEDGDGVGRRPAVVACLGGGGAYGIGLHFGVAQALQEFGLPLTGAPVLGTSAGAWAGAALSLASTWAR